MRAACKLGGERGQRQQRRSYRVLTAINAQIEYLRTLVVQGGSCIAMTPPPHLHFQDFDAITILVLTAALEDAWKTIAKEGGDLASRADVTRDLLAQGIALAAALGMRDRRKLKRAGLAYLGEYKPEKPG
jgi:hypothetical protein